MGYGHPVPLRDLDEEVASGGRSSVICGFVVYIFLSVWPRYNFPGIRPLLGHSPNKGWPLDGNPGWAALLRGVDGLMEDDLAAGRVERCCGLRFLPLRAVH
jgi:hypothetical protein